MRCLRTLLGGGLVLALLSAAAEAPAEKWSLETPLQIRAEYNDNIFLEEDSRSDFLTKLTAGLLLRGATEVRERGAQVELEGIAYADHDDLDALNQKYRLWYGGRVSPRLDLNVEGGYSRDSQPDRDLDLTGLVLDAERRDRYFASAGGRWAFSERTGGDLHYAFNRDDYGSSEESDVNSHALTAGLSRQINLLTEARVSLGAARYDFADVRVDNFSLALGGGRRLDEKWSVSGSLGGRYTTSDVTFQRLEPVAPDIFRLVTATETEDEWGGTGQLSVVRDGLLTTLRLTLSRDITAAAGREGTTERTALVLNLSRRWTYRLSGYLSAGIYLNEADRGEHAGEEIDQKTWRIGPSLRYRLAEDSFVEAGYLWTRVDDDADDTTAQRNSIFIRYALVHPWLEG